MYFAIVTPAIFNGGKEDTNGNQPVILSPIFGTMPYTRIINGTISKNLGFEMGKTYLINCELVDNTNPNTGEVNVQPRVTNLGEISAKELALSRRDFIDQMGLGKVEPKAEVSNGYPEPEKETANEVVPAGDGDPLGDKF